MSLPICTPQVCIFLSTFNGERFLADQLISIEQQTHTNWRVVLSDDGSTDQTLQVARDFQNKWGKDRLEIRHGPRKGFCLNFLSMVCDTAICADLYAFCDQDDVWLAEKLARAVRYFLQNHQPDCPQAYGSRTQIVDEALHPLDFSPLFTLPGSFRNALVQSIAGGNTQVFNQGAKSLLEAAGMQNVISHDWWLYQLVSGAGGIFFYDETPSILYRQHPNALVGANASFQARVERLRYVMNGKFKAWNSTNYLALSSVRHLLTRENQQILDVFAKLRDGSFKDRARLLEVCGLYRQTWQGTLSLWLATLINRI